ncbi:MAG: glycosyltransferase family 4 protein [Nitrospira sp.]|nr:glycosyltransferase family 4 protein [Nitrospira sp.]
MSEDQTLYFEEGKRKSSILYLSTSSGPGGAERVISSLVASLDPTRYRPLLCLFRPGWLQERAESQGVRTFVIPTQGMTDWRWALQFKRILEQEKVDLIHAHEFDANTQGTFVAALAGLPIVATVHGKNYFGEKLRRRLAYRWVSRNATMVAVSEDLKQFIVEKVGVSPNRVKVLYNGVNLLPICNSVEVGECRKELGLPPSHRIVGVVGNLYPVKGHQYLIDSIPTVLSKCPDTSFVFAGRGALEAELRGQVHRLGLDARVFFLGLRQDIPRILSMIDVFVLPSLSEGLSMAILEAMIAGKPVVATQVGGNPELVLNGETGFLTPPRDSQALAASLITLLMNKTQAQRFGEQGKRRAERQFSLQNMVCAYQALYDECIRSRL